LASIVDFEVVFCKSTVAVDLGDDLPRLASIGRIFSTRD